MVTVAGPPAELTMWAFGRAQAARVELIGSDPDVAAPGVAPVAVLTRIEALVRLVTYRSLSGWPAALFRTPG